MAYQRRMSGSAGPMSASGEASNGEPVQIELWINGEWVDITAYVMVRDDSGNISVTRGRRDEGSSADHATLNLLLDNRDGRWSPRNPTGTYYGLIGRNQPIRVSVPNGIGGKSYRFWGEVSSWPQFWDPTGTDVWVELEASGIIRRLSQGPPSENSLIYDAITSPQLSGLRAYWSCEDPSDAAEIKSALVNGAPMTFLDQAADLSSSTLFGASAPLPVFTNAAMTGGVVKYPSPSAGQVRFLLYIPPEGAASDLDVIIRVTQEEDITVTPVACAELFYNAPRGSLDGVAAAGSLSLEYRDGDGATLGALLHHQTDVRGRKLRVSLEFQESGSNIITTIRTLDLDTGVEVSVSDTRGGAQLTRCTRVTAFASAYNGDDIETATGLPGGVIGHITVQDEITDIEDLGLRLNPVGEAAGRRVQRLCAEGGVAFDSIGDLDDTVGMGGQEKLSALELMREAELADDGMLFESLAVMGLGYRTRASLINQDPQLTLNYAGFNLSEVPLPVEDDRYIQNAVTVTVNGFSQTYKLEDGALSTAPPPAGVGLYGQDITLNLENTADTTLLDQAAWRVHIGTVDEARHPQISVNLAHSTFTSNPALKQAVLGLRPGDRILVENPPAWLPSDDIDQIILGFEESITHFEHRVTFICAPASPYRVGVLDTVLARCDTDGSALVEAVNSSATSLTVAPTTANTSRVLWTTDASEFPFDVRLGGEVVTVSNITSWLDDSFTRTESSTWGTPTIGSAWAQSGGSATDYSVNGNAGVHLLSTVDVSRRSSVTAVSADFDIYCDITTSALATGASLFGAVTARMQNSTNMYLARLEFTTSNTVLLVLRKTIADVSTDLDSYTVPVTHVAGTYIRVRFQGYGNQLKAKAWAATDAVEPPEWHVEGTDNVLSQAYSVGTRSITVTGNTNVNPQIRYDNYEVVNPQVFTVTRSVNGVSKSQTAGTDIRLDKPTIISL
jgi:hypothetical protein